ncbi:5-dehydro-2-deoxygluconokinase [Thiotrichales bacterium 19X7-9]|nr:5-dehydro-2-deoxygluconokinase [Thiotrichales bacterium 19X7-9]
MSDDIFQADQNRAYDLICMGRVGVDLYAEQIDAPLRDVQSFKKYLGGSPGNISVGAARLGLKSFLFSGVGKDEMGQFLKQKLEHENVDTQLLQEYSNHLTALVILGVQPPSTFPLIFYRNDCADMQLKPEDVNESIIAQTKAFQFSGTGISTESMRQTTQKALSLCQRHQTQIVLDVDYRPVLWNLVAKGEGELRFKKNKEVTKHYQEFLPYCDLIVGTDEELCIAAGVDDPYQAIKIIQDMSKADIVFKTGLKGSEVHLYANKKVIKAEAFIVDVFNTLGAGDAYMSGLLAGLLKGETWQVALSYANASGAIVCARHGCAPAIPDLKELNYFISQYKKIGQAVLSDPILERMHQRVTIGKPSDYPLALLAYDHRWQFEKVCDENNLSYQKIKDFKRLVYQGFKQVNSSYKGQQRLGIICDPVYGKDVLREATNDGVFALAPIEASNIDLIQWLEEGKSAYEILNTQPQQWGVKVLWKYHRNCNLDMKKWQLMKLKSLYQACCSLERKLMLELIIPNEFELTAEAIKDAIEEVYQASVYPFWWKLQMVDSQSQWQLIDKTILGYDPYARIIILGGQAKSIEVYKEDFNLLKSSQLVNGFAFGRSIFWEAWLLYAQNKLTEDEVIIQIAKRYETILQMWADS